LFTQAGIDFYVEADACRATLLQKKLMALLSNPDHLRVLEWELRRGNKVDLERPSSKLGEGGSLSSQKIQEEVSKFHRVADCCIRNMVESNVKATERTAKLKKLDLCRQETELNDRIMMKRVKSQEKL
jgi:hypothetical protein